MRWIDFLIIGAVLIAAAFAVRHLVRSRGKCSCGCENCSFADRCDRKR